MTAIEYLKAQLNDPAPEPFSVQTRTALCAYAIRMKEEKEGYSISEAEKTIKGCGHSEDFTQKCLLFLSNANEAYQYISRIPQLDD